MDKKDMNAEILYQMTMSMARSMLSDGAITASEYADFDTKMQAKYRPIFGTLFADISLTSFAGYGNMVRERRSELCE